MRKLTIARSVQEMESLRPVWEHLAARQTMFQDFVWNRLAAAVFAQTQPPFVVMAESDSGACIIPACIDLPKRRISMLGEELFDYRNLLIAGDDSLAADAFKPLRDLAKQQNLAFGFHSLRAEALLSTDWFGLRPFTKAPCLRASPETRFHHPRLDLNFRRMQRQGITLRTRSGSDTGLIRQIYALKSEESDSLFHSPLRTQMLLAMCESSGPDCDVFTFGQGSTLVAALVTFRDRGWRRFYTIYYARAWSKHSPALTLLYLAMKHSLENGLHCDLMTGEQPYKLRLAMSSVPLFKIHATKDEFCQAVHRLSAHAA